MNTNKKVRTLTQLALFTALELILAFTPLGSIPIGPIVATTAHIPAVLAGIVLGPGGGAIIGVVLGICSFIVHTMTPTITSFVFTPFYTVAGVSGNFWSLVISFVPRILIGVVSGLIFRALTKRGAVNIHIGALIAGVFGSLTNTVLVLGGIYLFFGESFAQAIGQSYQALLGALGGVVLTNGIPEAILAALIAAAAAKPLLLLSDRQK
jgi:uncharacterized membrane protein